ncbi:MAG: hypothetical protein RL581_53 [Actinomycetota bacterium]|jgi:photosystem II stability/assembly factor-like uncharacterized protein
MKVNKVFKHVLVIAAIFANQNLASAATLDSVSHIHNVKVLGTQVLLGTHEGLYLYQGKNQMKMLGKENFDVMGLSISNGNIYASGHPNQGSKLSAPVGLISSADKGVSWNQISLQGKVDFHMLEVNRSEIYGADSQSGNLMYSSNRGKTWNSIGLNKLQDLAIGNKEKSAFGILENKLISTDNAFKSHKLIKTPFPAQTVDVEGDLMYVSSNKTLYSSKNSGKSWQPVSIFNDPIALVSISKQAIVVVAGQSILISRDLGKSFI